MRFKVPKRLTLAQMKRWGACKYGQKLFARRFPNGVKLTRALLAADYFKRNEPGFQGKRAWQAQWVIVAMMKAKSGDDTRYYVMRRKTKDIMTRMVKASIPEQQPVDIANASERSIHWVVREYVSFHLQCDLLGIE